jgi:hypothetical protein
MLVKLLDGFMRQVNLVNCYTSLCLIIAIGIQIYVKSALFLINIPCSE